MSDNDSIESLSSENDRFEISEKDKSDLVASTKTIIKTVVNDHILEYAKPKFKEMIIHHAEAILTIQLLPIIADEDTAQLVAKNIVCEAFEDGFMLPRAINPTTILAPVNVLKIKEQLAFLRNIPQPDQRTNEWYHFRHKYITASSAWKAFGTSRACDQLIYDKCKPLDISRYKSFSTDTPMHWGQKYEDVSIMWYETKYNTHVADFGCLPHPTKSYLAASPDGINDTIGPRYGRMVEVKNIVNREITGIPKFEYWIQMQLQMEVCDLDECDFLETRFIEYDDEEAFSKDGAFDLTELGQPKGIIMYFINEDGAPLYEYAPWGITADAFKKWETAIMEKHNHLTWMKNSYWKLDQVSNVLVQRNKKWFEAAALKLEAVWKIIEKEKVSGYAHRAPQKKQKNKITSNVTCSPNMGKCFINTHLLQGNKINHAVKSKSVCIGDKNKNKNASIKTTIEIHTQPLSQSHIQIDKESKSV